MDTKAAPGADARRATNPIFNDNKLKLGIFCTNTSAPQMSKAKERFWPTWERSLGVVQQADRIGLEAVVPLGSYRGPVLDKPDHPSHIDLEPFTWIAAVGALTRHISTISTVHTPLSTPAFIAKAMATIDQITGGRAGLNIVAGSSPVIFGVFGREIEAPATRYDRCQELVEVLRKFWTEDKEFDFDGQFYQVRRGISMPHPVQYSIPIINAGASERGSDFAAANADIAFTHIRGEPSNWKVTIDRYKNAARDKYNREVQVWTHGYVVVRDTQDEADAYLRYYSDEQADREWVESWIRELGENAPKLRPEQLVHMSGHWAAGGGFPLVGTHQSVLERLQILSDAGLDGILLTALEPEKMLDQFAAEMLPLLEKAGLRQPFRAAG
jgi:alkanesulfonate monooxygenase SsuD/methylene tetrahydromethanopterin reductase-like flavin-dependent oxidoreductase (luciferase family)